jgi:hypothetical protein
VNSSKLYAAGAGVVLLASTAMATSLTGAAVANDGHHHKGHHELEAHLVALNSSGVVGEAEVKVGKHGHLDIDVDATGVLADAPHAQHIHFGEEARHECPTIADDANHDFRLMTVEGLPAYGPIAVSLTTKGDTSPASGLAVDRFPTAPKGNIDYDRDTMTSKDVARAIRRGEAVVVIHGIDYNDNGKYDFDAGKSDLDPSLPAEATDPVACGVLTMD